MSAEPSPWRASVCVDRVDGDGWRWVDLPLTDTKLEAFLRDEAGFDIRLDDEGRLPDGVECRINDFDRVGLLRGLGITSLEGESITDLNLMCQVFEHQIHAEGDWVVEAVGAYVELDHPQNQPSAYEIANYAMQLEDIPFHSYGLDEQTVRNCDSLDEMYGMLVLDNDDMRKAMDEPLGNSRLTLGMYVDVERLGADCAMNDNVRLYDTGYYEQNRQATPDPAFYSRAVLRDMLADEMPDEPAMHAWRDQFNGDDMLPEYWSDQISVEDQPIAREVIDHGGSLLDFDGIKAIQSVIGSCDWNFYTYANERYGDDVIALCEQPVEAGQILGDLHDQYLNERNGMACDPAMPMSATTIHTPGVNR